MAEADVQGILFETVHRRKDGSTFAVEVSSRGASIADGRTLISVIRDITVRKEAEQGLRLSEKRYRSYIEVTGQLGWTTNADGEVVEDIPSWRQFTGQSENEVKGWGWSTAIHPDDLGHTVRAWGEAVATRSHYETEYRIRRNDGVYRYFLARGVPVYGDDGTIQEWVGTCIDITDRKRTEEELLKSREELEIRVQERTSDLAKANETLRHLSSRLLSAQEDERKRVAGELHDTIGSSLNGVRYKIEDLRQQIAKGSIVTAESLSSLTTVLQEGIEECRRMQQDLRPALLDDLGLLPTLSWFCRRYQTIYTGIQVVMEQTLEEADIPDSLKVVIFRITQEGMNNIAKHSKADLVRLSLGKKAAGIELVLKDNGQGFDPNKVPGLASAKWGLGLTSMKERAQLSGGILTVESAEGKGTTLRASWPSGRKKLPPSGLAS
jgi:PAS domain S-box-containing protein